MLLRRGQVVRDVVHEVDGGAGLGPEDPTHRLGEQLPVRTPVVGRGHHRREVGLSLGRADRCARQLTVGHADAVPAHGPVHLPDVVAADLVTEPSRPAVDHHAHGPRVEPHPRRRGGVEQAVDDLDLEEVVPGAEAAELPEAAVERPLADRRPVGTLHHPVGLAPLQVAGDPVTLLHREPGAALEDPAQRPAVRQPPHPVGAHASRDGLVQPVHHRAEPRHQTLRVQVPGHEEPHPARDVEADPSW